VLADGTYAASALLRALGVKGGQLPKLALSTYTPVMVMGDFSKTLASEPLEARGLAAEYQTGIAGQALACGLFCNAPGGCIVESARINLPAAPVANVQVNMGIATTDTWVGWTEADIQNIGGRPVRSTFRLGSTVGVQIVAGMSTLSAEGRMVTLQNHRIFVPGGYALWFQAAHLAQDVAFEMVWRELEEPIGGP
jgi:hypothetical protein